jgi:hypothetical protein
MALFLFRLAFGLSSEFLSQDETQIYLIGLRYYATGHWPYFGPDVVWTETQVAGALQGLLVGWPFKVAAVPEAPYVLLNLLSTAALALLAWYIGRRLPSLPSWLVWGWIFTAPWTLHFSTHINNASYVLPASVVFFVGFFEALPWLRTGSVPVPFAHFMMGAAITWVMQIHMSWPLLLPYAGIAWLSDWRSGSRRPAVNAGALMAGALVPGSLLVPTLFVYGPGSGGGLRNIQFHAVSPIVALNTLARFLSFASLEVVRFVGFDNPTRFAFFQHNLWIVPLALVVWVAGLVQPVWMLRQWFRRRSPHQEWPVVRLLTAASVVLVYVAFWFVIERATEAHAFYILAPLAFIFLAYCWTFADSPRSRRVAAVLLACSVAFHAGLAAAQGPARSLYRHRDVVAAAISAREPELLGHRRAFAIDAGPPFLNDLSRPFDPGTEILIEGVRRMVNSRGVVEWRLTLRNTSPRVAYRDVLVETNYTSASGDVVDTRRKFITGILQPGDTRPAEVNDGVVSTPFAEAAVKIVGGEALIPLSAVAARR